jgi:hypothetical protein
LPDGIEPVFRRVAEREYACTDMSLSDFCNLVAQFFLTDEIDLTEQDNRLDMTFIHHDQISLHPVQVEIEVARLDYKSNINIRSYQLVFAFVAGGSATQKSAPWENIVDDCK